MATCQWRNEGRDMGRITNLIKIAFKSLLKRNRGNILFVSCVFLMLLIPTVQFNITQSVMNQVEVSHKRVFGSFTDIYYDNSNVNNARIGLSDSEFSEILPGFHYEDFGVLYTVFQQELPGSKMLRLGYADNVAKALADITLVKGAFPHNSNEVALTESVSEALGGKALGDQIQIGDSTYTISGILLDFGYLWPQSETQKDSNVGTLNALVTEQEAARISQQTAQVSRQILIVRQLGVSNTTENDSNLLRNTNNSLENSSHFQVPNEFAILMMIAMQAAVFMILILNRNRLANRVYNYYKLGLCKSDVSFIIRFELIFLGFVGAILGVAVACAISSVLLTALPIEIGQTIPRYVNVEILSKLFLAALAGLLILIFFHSRLTLRFALQENASKVDRHSRKEQKTHLFPFVIKQNTRTLFALTILITLSFCLLSFGVFYSAYFTADIAQQPVGMLPKDYDLLFAARVLPAAPSNGDNAPFYFTDTYEKMGADSSFIARLASLPQVKQVKAYKEINKMSVLLSDSQIDDYIDAQDYVLDKKYSEISQTGISDMDFFREQYGYRDHDILVGAEILTYPAEVLSSLSGSVVEGTIDLKKIASGEEIVLRVPAYRIRTLENGGIMKYSVPYKQKDAYNSTTFHVGDSIHMSGILSDEAINGPVLESKASSFYRKDFTVKVGAIIRDTNGLFSSSGSFGKTFSILTLDEALPIYGLEANYSNVSVYSKQGYSAEEVSQSVSNLSNQVPNMVLTDYQKEVQTYKIYKFMINLYVASLLIVLVITTGIILSSQLLAKTQLNMRSFSLLRINGVSFGRIVRLLISQVLLVLTVGCSLGVPASLLLFRNMGTYANFEILNQITYYFPLINFVYVFIGVVIIAVFSLIPSIAYLIKHKDNVLYDVS